MKRAPAALFLRRRAAFAAVVGGLAAAIATGVVAGPLMGVGAFAWVGHVELDLFQRRLVEQPIPPSPDVVLVSIEEDTPRLLGLPSGTLPLPRRYHAAMIAALKEARANSLILDLVFDAPSSPADDRALTKALATSDPLRVVLAADYDRKAGETAPDSLTGWKYRFRMPAVLPERTPRNLAVSSAVAWDPGGPLAGVILLRPDSGTGQVLPHLALSAVLGLYHIASDRAVWDVQHQSVRAASLAWPVGADGEVLTRYTASGNTFTRYEFAEALKLLADREGRQRFEGKIVALGDFSGADTHQTRRGRMDGTEFVANTVNTLLLPGATQLDSAGLPANFMWTWLMAACASMAVSGFRWRDRAGGVGLTLLLLASAPALFFTLFHLWIYTLTPALAAAIATAGTGLAASALAGRWAPLYLRSGRPHKVTEEATVLFVDLRGSTPLVQRLSPELASAAQAELLTRLSQVIHQAGGEVERTLGDGLVAIFRPPGNHGECAARAIPWLQSAAEGLSPAWLAKYGVGAGVTIGMESGIVAGTVLRRETGEEEWSSSGLTVNLAARLQGACGELGEPVLLGPGAAALVRQAVGLRYLGSIHLKGMSQPTPAYTLARMDAAECTGVAHPAEPATTPGVTLAPEPRA